MLLWVEGNSWCNERSSLDQTIIELILWSREMGNTRAPLNLKVRLEQLGVRLELPQAVRIPKLSHRQGLNLSDALARDVEV